MVAGRPPPTFCVGPMPHDVTASPEPPSSSGMIPSFMNNIMSPFMNCWQPPINPCVTPGRPSRSTPAVVSPMHDRQKPQPKTNIRDPHPNDVLCGRGGSSNRHIGNLNFRSLVGANKEMYVTLTKKQKMLVARKIVDTIHNQDPPGRFLQKDPQTGLWFDIGMPRSLEKTSQALREKSTSGSVAGSVTSSSVADETLSDPGSLISAATKSPPLSPRSSLSPPSTPMHSGPKGGPALDVPDITIPEHLEAQFRPNKQVDIRPPPAPRSWGAEYRHDFPPPPHGYPLHPPPHHHPPPQPYLHPYPNKGDSRLQYRPHPAYSTPPYVPVDHREHRPPPPRMQAYHSRLPPPHPYPPVTPSAGHGPPPPLMPATPDRRHHQQYHHRHSAPHPPYSPSKEGSQRGGRPTGEVSPGRAQAWKKRRTTDEDTKHGSNSESSLSHDMQRSLSLQEEQEKNDGLKELASPTSLLQGRSRRSCNDALAGLAALSSAALLKLDESK